LVAFGLPASDAAGMAMTAGGDWELVAVTIRNAAALRARGELRNPAGYMLEAIRGRWPLRPELVEADKREHAAAQAAAAAVRARLAQRRDCGAERAAADAAIAERTAARKYLEALPADQRDAALADVWSATPEPCQAAVVGGQFANRRWASPLIVTRVARAAGWRPACEHPDHTLIPEMAS
jgi:hypothetical protein